MTGHSIRVNRFDGVDLSSKNGAIRGNGGGDFPELTRPDMVLASAAGIATTATDSTHMASQNDHAITAGRDVSYSAGRSYHVAARGAVSLFAYQQGMKFIAAKGAWIAQAQNGPMSLAALDDVTVSSTDGRIVITASKRVWIGAGGSYIDISGSGITNGSPGPILEKGASWDMPGPDSKRMMMPTLPSNDAFHEQFRLLDEDGETPLSGRYYEVHSESGKMWSGYSDNEGLTERVYTEKPEELTLRFERKDSANDEA